MIPMTVGTLHTILGEFRRDFLPPRPGVIARSLTLQMRSLEDGLVLRPPDLPLEPGLGLVGDLQG